ncbi:MAG: transcription elongation factor GreA [Cardiobacteriaceae bacterium]|nr:transcription elongation factor GreA [Cardiobacteriaceae bacterium]
MSTKIPMTKNGAEALKAELERLKTQERPRIIEAIAEARALGDLKENAEYHSAREQQGFIEGRIKELEYKLSNANVIDVTTLKNTGKVVFGTTVEMEDVDSGEVLRYQIVGEDEADLNLNKISNTSPIARALMGKEAGETVQVVIPNGKRTLDILEVFYE